MDQTGKRFFVRVLSVCYCIQGPTMTEQPKGEALRCLEFGVTLPLWHVLAGSLNQRVLGSIPGRPTKFFYRGIANCLFILTLKTIAWRL
jgi:hypothetical protein